MVLEILGITAPESAVLNEEVNFTVHTKNTGGGNNFKVELTGYLTDSIEFSLSTLQERDMAFSFTMPNNDVSITVNTYHWLEGIGWVWDSTSAWELLFPFMSIP